MIELMAIPGIGPYTAAAIRNFAFNLPTPCIDTNIRRILHRTFFGPENRDGTWKKDDHILLGIAEDVLQEAMDGQKDHDTRNWHAALMDFGSLIQTKRNPQWEECPLTEKGIMVTSRKSASLPSRRSRSSAGKGWNEPGREIGGRFIPNRIIRGRIVEELRDEPKGLKLAEIGRRVCIDWAMRRHQRWMKELLEKLQKDRLIAERKGKFLLSSDG